VGKDHHVSDWDSWKGGYIVGETVVELVHERLRSGCTGVDAGLIFSGSIADRSLAAAYVVTQPSPAMVGEPAGLQPFPELQ
jgi:hypothetical protein